MKPPNSNTKGILRFNPGKYISLNNLAILKKDCPVLNFVYLIKERNYFKALCG